MIEVKLIDKMGSDLTVVNAARVSFHKESTVLTEKDKKLIEVVARELSISPATLERWRAQALSTPTRQHTWTAAARFEAVLMTAALDETAKSAWCRKPCILFIY